ncbi:MAG: HAD-IB family phosphatase [Clostridia bacterium]|nr:HAD-IB family phosphatase [Clostridia bacterium]
MEFVKFVFGKKKLYLGLLLFSPLLLLMKVRLYPNGKVKKHIFSWFFKDMEYEKFAYLGRKYAKSIATFARKDTTDILRRHLQRKHHVYVVTASIEEWVRPYCEYLCVEEVIGTKIEVNNGVITGRFASNNCYGKEKVVRFIELEPKRNSYILYAYGDSSGDKEMLSFADHGIRK